MPLPFLGEFLEACSADSLEDTTDGTTPPTDNGYTNRFDIYYWLLFNFSQLAEPGDWMNGQNLGIPMLSVSNSEIKAYTNICPTIIPILGLSASEQPPSAVITITYNATLLALMDKPKVL